jgi:hypothetical protein
MMAATSPMAVSPGLNTLVSISRTTRRKGWKPSPTFTCVDRPKLRLSACEEDSEGQFVGAFNNYNNLEEFERLF